MLIILPPMRFFFISVIVFQLTCIWVKLHFLGLFLAMADIFFTKQNFGYYTILKLDSLRNIWAKFGSIPICSFRGEDFYVNGQTMNGHRQVMTITDMTLQVR